MALRIIRKPTPGYGNVRRLSSHWKACTIKYPVATSGTMKRVPLKKYRTILPMRLFMRNKLERLPLRHNLNCVPAQKPSCCILVLLLFPYKENPMKLRKPRDMRPTRINVIPRPLNGAGTLEYFIFSRTPASATIASIHPIPDPSPNTVASARL